MDFDSHCEKQYDSDASSHPFFFSQAAVRRNKFDKKTEDVQVEEALDNFTEVSPITEEMDGGNSIVDSMFGKYIQEMVLRALQQSTTSLVGSSSSLLHFAGEAEIGFPNLSTREVSGDSTWNELEYRKSEAKRKRKSQMMRTSAGEESDSQADFPLLPNSTPEQRALRTRRLNRWRAKKANDLTSNRKAVKKLPYVIHVDGTSKPRDIHRHLWKKAVRGQCGRLDPSMDNINHHPKHVVDSIWHALEKEWEFQGFAHKAREMFEKSATKFMRNKKMQLKYKCQKMETGVKPEDVSKTHWLKIVELTKKLVKKEAASTSGQSSGKSKSQISEHVKDSAIMVTENEVIQGDTLKESLELKSVADKFVASQEEEVEAQMKKLRSQLQWLEKSIKAKQNEPSPFTEVVVKLTEEKGSVGDICRAATLRKENVMPSSEFLQKDGTLNSMSTAKGKEKMREGDAFHRGLKHNSTAATNSALRKTVLQEVSEDNVLQMECEDVICIVAVTEGEEQKIGKGILMGVAGSKLYRKVIPNGWCSIKVSSYNSFGGSEACPFPVGWKDHVKHKTLRDAEGQIILWPKNLLHI